MGRRTLSSLRRSGRYERPARKLHAAVGAGEGLEALIESVAKARVIRGREVAQQDGSGRREVDEGLEDCVPARVVQEQVHRLDHDVVEAGGVEQLLDAAGSGEREGARF